MTALSASLSTTIHRGGTNDETDLPSGIGGKLDCDAAFDFADTLQETTCRKLKSGLGYERTFEERLVTDLVIRWFANQGPAGLVTTAKRGA